MLHTVGLDRFIYALYLVVSILFYGIGLVSAYGVLLRLINFGLEITLTTWLFVAYAIINFLIGYGFMYHRRWLLIAFTGGATLMIFQCVYFFSIGDVGRATFLYPSIALLSTILLFLFITRRALTGEYTEGRILTVFFVTLLFSFWVTISS
ncbi:hypothetical protein ACFL6I_18135 [candidate division KSB1 bacterium]